MQMDRGGEMSMGELEKRTEILAVSFGTSYPETREKTIGAIEKCMADRFPEASVHRCFTSRVIRGKLLERDGIRVDSPEEAILDAKKRGVRRLVVQPLYLMRGREYDGLAAVLKEQGDSFFEKVAFGEPLLSGERDFQALTKAIRRQLPMREQNADTAVVLMGHGTELFPDREAPDPNEVYHRLQESLREAGAEDYFIATVEGTPRLSDVLSVICTDRKGRYRNVILAPLMIVAGDHALHDLAGGEEGSWKSIFMKKGFRVKTDLRGIGEWEEVRELFAVHASEAAAASDI